jgi:hypothetical protein
VDTTYETKLLPPVLKTVLGGLGFRKRLVNVRVSTQYSMASPGNEGSRGFFGMVSLNPPKLVGSIQYGNWGGGGLGKPSPVDTDTTSRSLADGMVVVQGQTGGYVYVNLVMTPETFEFIQQDPRMPRKPQKSLLPVYVLKNHNGVELARHTDIRKLTDEMLRYEMQTGNPTRIEILQDS